MASTRSPSPASRGGSPAPMLTPRSKIKALLATVESSDDEDGVSSGKTKKKSPQEKAAAPQGSNNGGSPIDSRRRTRSVEESDSDIDIRPRGKLASRMKGATATKAHEPSKDPNETARERVKRLFEQEEQVQAKETREEDRGAEAEAEDDDEDLPVAPRRLKQRVARSVTPEEADETPQRPDSPGLFVSSPVSKSPSKDNQDGEESDNDLPAVKSDRFKALVQRKKEERLAREAAEEAKNAERRARQEKLTSEMDEIISEDGISDVNDDEDGRRLTQEVRPTRKASKKAIEEMNRETQRMARSMQLAHEARTRKKLSTSALFERFNYKPANAGEQQTTSSSRPASPQSDVEMKDAETPPSSPPLTKKQELATANEAQTVQGPGNSDDELPALDVIMSSDPKNADQITDKGKGKAPAVESEKPQDVKGLPKRRVRVRLPITANNFATVGSDDELEVTTTTKDKIDAIFNSVPLKKDQEKSSLHALRALAQVKSPGKQARRKEENHGMTPGEFQYYLQQKAREQAKSERDRRLDLLKAQGAEVQTAEDREREMQEVEDLVAKARAEAQTIMQQERAAAKKNKGDGGEVDPLAWDDSEDEEYVGSGEEADAEGDAEESAPEYSGSEDEEGNDDGDGDDGAQNPLFESEAEDADSEQSDAEVSKAPRKPTEVDDEADLPALKRNRSRKHTTVLSDDDEVDDVEATPKPKTAIKGTPAAAPGTDSPAAPTSVLRSAKKAFIPGLPVQGPAGLGLTQIFAGTMDDSQMSPTNAPTQSMMPDFDHFPDSNFSATMDQPNDERVVDSQLPDTQKATQGVQLDLMQSQKRGLDSLLRDDFNTQASDNIELSQDVGLQRHTPLMERFVEPPISTVETIPAGEEQQQDSPIVRRGRLRRRAETALSEEATVPASPEKTAPVEEAAEGASDALGEGAKKIKKQRVAAEEFDKKKSKAKEMVEDQADESEDEYAGLGGADGEDSDSDAASVQDMIDDAAGQDADGRKLAALHAGRERAKDEQEVEKLFKDITTGMLRRKRGADYDLSDSDDGGEARRRMKRRQFAKMQKALFSDERVKKMAENPGNQAFLRTIEDRGSDDEMDRLQIDEEPEQPASQSESQSQPEQQGGSQQQQDTIPDSQPRRPLAGQTEKRAPAHMRRTKGGKKPSNIGEVRETLSNLLDEPQGSVIPATEAGSDSEEDELQRETTTAQRSDKENQAPRRVVDRISLKRNTSSTSASSSNGGGGGSGSGRNRLAFAAASSSSFKVPALLRRATTNSSALSGTSTTTGSSSAGAGAQAGAVHGGGGGGFGDDAKIKKAASKKSGINGFARDQEKRSRIAESERRRQERRVKGAERRVGVVGGLLGKGSFE